MVYTKRKYTTKNTVARKRVTSIPRTMVVMKPEMKHIAATISYSAIQFAAIPMMTMAQGTSRQTRLGNKIKLHAIELLLSTTGGAPIRSDILEPLDGTTAPTYAFAGTDDRSSYTVIRQDQLTSGSPNSSDLWRCYHRFTPARNVTYKDAAVGSCVKGNMFLCLSTPANATIQGYFRLWFTDA